MKAILLKQLIETLGMEHKLEIRDENNYILFNCLSNSTVLKHYINEMVIEWFASENRSIVVLIGEENESNISN